MEGSAMADDWKDEANCRNMDTELFFPGLGGNVPQFVKEVCAECTVSEECLWYANETSADYGVWGGMSPRERQAWRRKNRVTLGQRRAA